MKHIFYFDLDNLDVSFFSSVFERIFFEKNHDDIFLKFYSSDLNKSFIGELGLLEGNLGFDAYFFDAGGKKVFGKEAVDRVVSMDVIKDLYSGDLLSVGFISNDYDFYGTLLLMDKFFDKSIEKSFFYDPERLKLPKFKNGVSSIPISAKGKKEQLRLELVTEVLNLNVKYNGSNSTEIYVTLLRKGVDVKKYIGNNSFTSFLRSDVSKEVGYNGGMNF